MKILIITISLFFVCNNISGQNRVIEFEKGSIIKGDKPKPDKTKKENPGESIRGDQSEIWKEKERQLHGDKAVADPPVKFDWHKAKFYAKDFIKRQSLTIVIDLIFTKLSKKFGPVAGRFVAAMLEIEPLSEEEWSIEFRRMVRYEKEREISRIIDLVEVDKLIIVHQSCTSRERAQLEGYWRDGRYDILNIHVNKIFNKNRLKSETHNYIHKGTPPDRDDLPPGTYIKN